MRIPSLRIALACAFVVGLAGGQALPPVPIPGENPLTPQKAILGKILFWDEQLSAENTTACGTCHMPEVGGGDPRAFTPRNLHPGHDGILGTADDVRGSRGITPCDAVGAFTNDGMFYPEPFVTNRKAPGVIGAQWEMELFWDGRAKTTFRDPVTQQVLILMGGALENQALQPPVTREMGCDGASIVAVAARLAQVRPLRLAVNLTPDIQSALTQHPTYTELFAAAFGDPAVTPAHIAMAIASYERTLVPDQTPWDLWHAGNAAALTPQQLHGLQLFNTTSSCGTCHPSPRFTDSWFHNTGLRPPAEDMGLAAITGTWADRGKFRTPTLRNAGLRAPFFHTGSLATLADVIEFYRRGGDFSENRDALMFALPLTPSDAADLLEFVQVGLTDPRVAQRLPPFDRPTLRSELGQNPEFLGAGSTGSGGLTPRMLASIPPAIGSPRFGFGLAHAVGGTTALLGVSSRAAPPGTTILGAPVYLDLDPQASILIPLATGGQPGAAGAGRGSVMVTIAETPALSGLSLFAQWAVLDPWAGAGLAVSSGVRFTFFAP